MERYKSLLALLLAVCLLGTGIPMLGISAEETETVHTIWETKRICYDNGVGTALQKNIGMWSGGANYKSAFPAGVAKEADGSRYISIDFNADKEISGGTANAVIIQSENSALTWMANKYFSVLRPYITVEYEYRLTSDDGMVCNINAVTEGNDSLNWSFNKTKFGNNDMSTADGEWHTVTCSLGNFLNNKDWKGYLKIDRKTGTTGTLDIRNINKILYRFLESPFGDSFFASKIPAI